MNGPAIFGDQLWRNQPVVPRTIKLPWSKRPNVMDTIYFVLAVAVTSAAIFALMMRADRINRRRGSSDGASDPSINDSAVRSWFGPYGGGRNDW